MRADRAATTGVFALACALVGLTGCSETQKPDPAPSKASATRSAPKQKLYVGPTFVTHDDKLPEAKAIATDADGRIKTVFKEVPPRDDYEVVELGGALAVAGLHDAHAHLLGTGQSTERVDLLGAKSPGEIKERLEKFAAAHPDASFIRGRGWDQSLFADKKFPTWRDVEGGTSKPAILSRVDGHAVLVNKALLDRAGIDEKTKDPDGGRILRDKDGKPTGVFVDNAIDLVSKVLPEPSLADLERWLQSGVDAAADAGLVAVHDMGFPLAALPLLKKLDDAGRLPIRVYVYLDGSDDKAVAQATSFPDGKRYEIRGVKLFADGAMGSRGAALIDDYSDEAGHKGLLLTEPKVLEDRVRSIHAAGKQAAIHAIGDRGNRTALEAIAQVQGDDSTRRHRLEHSQLIHADDFDGFKKLGVIASMQPTHATSDMRWAEKRVGAERVKGAYAWRTMLDKGVPLAFGSDSPVESIKPAWGLYAAVARQDHEGSPEGGWRPEQKLTVDEALRAFSLGAAYAVAHDEELGALKPGFRLDLSIFDIDARGDAKAWLRAKPVATVVDGGKRDSAGGA
jgi:predicted amidohydrolase YtcJ